MQVSTAAQARARDETAIASGVDGFTLMLRAGTAAAEVLAREAQAVLGSGADIYVGSGNNGGDGYVVAAQLARLGVPVRVHVIAPPATHDATRAERLARRVLPDSAFRVGDALASGQSRVLVDALLGTGARGPLREPVRAACEAIVNARALGALVFALDVPTGVNATTGETVTAHIVADVTIMFGTCKLGALAARHACGSISVVEIGLGPHAHSDDGAPQLAEPRALNAALPDIAWDAHKGTRGRVLIVGGTTGMSGAVQLAASGALASGAGLVRACVHNDSVGAMQCLSPAVVCLSWPDESQRPRTDATWDPHLDESIAARGDMELAADGASLQQAVRTWANVVAIGPGLGRDERARRLLNEALEMASSCDVSLVLDADALTVLAKHGMSDAFRACARNHRVVLTPHAGEFASLARAANVAAGRGDPESRLRASRELAATLSCTVLLKGTPTLVASPDGSAWCVPRGSAALATGGTGDVLTGVLAAVIASVRGARGPEWCRNASAIAAWVHGVAGERLPVRGSTVRDVVCALPDAWAKLQNTPSAAPNVLCVLPAPPR